MASSAFPFFRGVHPVIELVALVLAAQMEQSIAADEAEKKRERVIITPKLFEDVREKAGNAVEQNVNLDKDKGLVGYVKEVDGAKIVVIEQERLTVPAGE